MGSISTHKQSGMSMQKFFEGEFPELEFLKCKSRRDAFYAAVRNKNKPETVFALVIKITRDYRNYYNITYKDMDETVEPYYYDCPNNILDLLTEPLNDNATKWRAECRRLNAIALPEKGDVVVFEHEITWRYRGWDRGARKFRYDGKRVFYSYTDGYVRLPVGWHKYYQFTINPTEEVTQ